MGQKYYPLHVHTSIGSVGDSILGVSDYVKKAVSYGLDALAITDHGSMSAMYAFAQECQKQQIKPIIGMEAYIVDNNDLAHQKEEKYVRGAASHLVLLAKDNQGLENLLKIHNQAATEGYYYEARTDWEHLQKWGKGIIALSACVGGEIPKAILDHDDGMVRDLIGFYKECFDAFYLEIQPGDFEEQRMVNHALVRYSKECNVPLVVTNDIHYLTAEDAKRHDYHVKLGRRSKDKMDEAFIYPDTCYWFMSVNDIRDAFQYDDVLTEDIVEDAISNTEQIAKACNIDFDTRLFMPTFPTEKGVTEEELLYRLCFTRLNAIIEGKPNPQEYVDRLTYELKVIKDKGFCGYFLIVADYVNWARCNGIPVGPGRGSAAGSLVTYLMGICQADPIKYGLLFERFLDPHREAVPDIDVDFAPGENGRDRMFRYAVERYGYDHCALVSTMGIRKAKGAIHDAARILGYEPAIGNEIAKLIPTVYYGDDGEKQTDLDIKTSIEVTPELKRYQKSYPDIIQLAMDLEGIPSTRGIHAAGLLISPISLKSHIPLIKPNKDGVLATALTLDDAEISFVKFDFLALGTLDIIKNTENDVGWAFDFQDDSLLHDDAVWDVIGSRNTTGIFQIASKTYKDRMCRLKPRSIEELAACLALVRGPSISAKTDELYMQILEGKKEVRHIHPLYDEITKDTNGVLIYQEQIMHLAVAFGMDLTTGYRIVKDSAKKRIEKLKAYRETFVKLAQERDCDTDTANEIFDMIVESGKYSFNKSHAVSYALITYASAYLKVHYPLAFARNLLTYTYTKGKDKEYHMVLEDCRNQGIQFLPADINLSRWEFTVEKGKIRVGFCAVKGFGEKAAEAFTNMTKGGLVVADMQEMMTAIEEDEIGRIFNKKVMTVAIFSGLCDSFLIADDTRLSLYQQYLAIRDQKEEVPDEIKLGTKGFVVNPSEDDDATLENLFYGNAFIYDPANDLESFGWKDVAPKSLFEAYGYIRKVKKVKTKKNEQMAFVTLSTGDGIIDCTVFPNVYADNKKILKTGALVKINAQKESSNACVLKEAEKVEEE